MEKKANEIDEFSFMNQKSNVVSMKFLGEKPLQTKKNLKLSNIINNNDSLAKHMTGYAKEKARLQMIIQNLQDENARLSCQVALIEGAKSQGDRDKIFREFEADFNNKAFRLEQRKKKLMELDKLVHSFRCIEQEEEELSKIQNSPIKNNSEEPVLFTRKQKLTQSSLIMKEKAEMDKKFALLDDSDDEPEEDLSKSSLINLQQRPETTFSKYRKKKTIKTRKPKKYLVTPPPQSLIVTNINPFPLNKSSYPPSAAISAASALAFQQQSQSTITTTTTTTIKSGQQHKTVQFMPQHQKQRPSKVLQNVQKIVETDALYHQNLNARRNIPPPTPLASVTSAVPLRNSNEPPKMKNDSNTQPAVIDRAELVSEHERLVAISLNLERVMLVKKMQLRLCHDHRDLCSLRLMFDSIEGGESANTTEKQISRRYKTKIKNLRNQIQREKTRLIAVMQKQTKEERAAISIQNLMRGFLCRIRLKGIKIINTEVNETNSSENNSK